MSWIWRALVATLLVAGPAFWLPVVATDAASQYGGADTAVRGPVEAKDDPEDLCDSGNPRKQKKCRFNGWENWNQNENDNEDTDPDPSLTGATITQDGLTVELWRSTDSPAVNAPLMLAVKGDGAQITRVWWWAEGPVFEHRHADDMAHLGEMSYDCGATQPCAWSWNVVPRDVGVYIMHARIRDTSGRELQTDWRFETANP